MPTEHEFKYVLSLDFLNEFDESILRKTSTGWTEINQGYVAVAEGTATRIRQARTVAPRHYGNSEVDHWTLTFKHTVNSRVIEIEKELDSRDGQDLWSACTRRVCKTRYYFPDGDHTWELDLFKTDQNVYFILAEVELPEGSSRPTLMPSFLSKYMIYEVDLTDNQFSNKKLGDVEYAAELYKKIKKGIIVTKFLKQTYLK